MKEVAIALATYNGGKYIGEQLESLVNQTYKDFCCYIHDDGSSDDTIAVVDTYCTLYPDRFVRLDYPSVHKGPICNFMGLLERIEEPYIMLCDQDDIWDENKILYSLEEMRRLEADEREERPLLIFCNLEVVDEQLQTISDSFYRYIGASPVRTSLRDLFIQNCAPGCTMMINQELRNYAIRIDHPEELSMHDVWLMLIASSIGRISYMDQPLIKYRQHAANSIGAQRSTLWRGVKETLTGVRFRDTSRALRRRRNNIIHLEKLHLDGLRDEDRQFIHDIAAIDHMPKLRRMVFYRRHRLYRNSGIMAVLCC